MNNYFKNFVLSLEKENEKYCLKVLKFIIFTYLYLIKINTKRSFAENFFEAVLIMLDILA